MNYAPTPFKLELPQHSEGRYDFSRVCLFTGEGGPHVNITHYAIGQSNVTWGPPDLFKLVHLGYPPSAPKKPQNPPQPWSLSSTHMTPPIQMMTYSRLVQTHPTPQYFLKLVHYVAHTSISKRTIGLRLKGLLVHNCFSYFPNIQFHTWCMYLQSPDKPSYKVNNGSNRGQLHIPL